jgi:hypothetical protein
MNALVCEWFQHLFPTSPLQVESTLRCASVHPLVAYEVLLSKGCAQCPYASRVHSNSQILLTLSFIDGTESGSAHISCQAAECKSCAPIALGLSAAQIEKLLSLVEVPDNEERSQLQPHLQLRQGLVSAGLTTWSDFGAPLPLDARLEFINRRFLLPLDRKLSTYATQFAQLFNYEVVFIKSSMGGGKSFSVRELIKQIIQTNPNARILYITCRVSQAEDFLKAAKESNLDFVSYLDRSSTKLENVNRLVIQLDSLHRLQPDSEVPVAPYDLVVLDESESLLKHFSSTTLKGKRTDIWQLFHTIVQQAKKVIVMDAHLGLRTHRIISLFRPNTNVHSIVNTHRTDQKSYFMTSIDVVWKEVLCHLLEEGKRIAIPCNHKEEAKRIAHWLKEKYPHLKIKTLTSESSDADKKADCNTFWTQFDILIYTPTIGCGVDFQPHHFHHVMPYGITTSNPAREFEQQIGRIRHPIDKEVYMYIQPQPARPMTHPLKWTRESLKGELNHRYYDLKKTDEDLLSPMLRDMGPYGVVYHDPVYLELYLLNRAEEELSSAHFETLLCHSIQSRGGRFESSPFESSVADLRALGKEVDSSSVRSYLRECSQVAGIHATSFKNATESFARCEQRRASEWDKRLKEKVRLKNMYKLRQVSADSNESCQLDPRMTEFVVLHGQPKTVKSFHSFYGLNLPLHLLEERARSQLNSSQDMPCELQQPIEYNKAKLVRGLLAVLQFKSNGTPSPLESNAFESMGDICSTSIVSTQKITNEWNTNPIYLQWLRENKKDLLSYLDINDFDPDTISPPDLIKKVSGALDRFCMLSIQSETVNHTRKRQRSRVDGKQVSDTKWRIGSIAQRDAMLELAYSSAVDDPWGREEWNVEATVKRVRPIFQWQALTGLQQPEYSEEGKEEEAGERTTNEKLKDVHATQLNHHTRVRESQLLKLQKEEEV